MCSNHSFALKLRGMRSFGEKITNLLESPTRVGVLCVVLLFVGVVFNKSLWRLYQIHQSKQVLLSKITEESDKTTKLKQQLDQLKNPAYIEKQARERLEFLEKNDLLFVFSEE